MSFLTEDEVANLTINRMIFHVVGKELQVPILLNEIRPIEHSDFFLGRIKSSLKGNHFTFLERSNTERILRIISNQADANPDCFSEQSKLLASDFQSHHKGNTSRGVFFVFELHNDDEKLYALIKYDNEDVVRYLLDQADNIAQVPRLERFSESFVKKPEAMQKIALVKLLDQTGGEIVVLDRSKRSNISEYFEGFLQVRRTHTEQSLNEKFVDVLKKVFKENKEILPPSIAKCGVNRIFEYLAQGAFEFNTAEPNQTLTAIFGQLDENSPVIKSFVRESRSAGILGEAFNVNPQFVQKPKRRKIETTENVVIMFDEDNAPERTVMADGRTEIKIITARITVDDIDTTKIKRGN